LKKIDFSLEKGEVIAIIGPSGSGKTTLLRCLNFLERPDKGSIIVNNEVIFDAMDPSTQRESEVRKKTAAFRPGFSKFNLFPQYTVLKNVTLAAELLAKNARTISRIKSYFERDSGPGQNAFVPGWPVG